MFLSLETRLLFAVSVANKNLTNFLAVFKLFHVCDVNRFESTTDSYYPDYSKGPAEEPEGLPE
jgi:hypothetical protein